MCDGDEIRIFVRDLLGDGERSLGKSDGSGRKKYVDRLK
jgi:hypothetical protein